MPCRRRFCDDPDEMLEGAKTHKSRHRNTRWEIARLVVDYDGLILFDLDQMTATDGDASVLEQLEANAQASRTRQCPKLMLKI
jgi:hypothetical protein